ncbi:MAG: PD40 domain-containing protein, partial [Bacteroidales bacterium]|nr:PD40 domain-containing protein [Bacteroidales bacterium]
MKKLTLLTVLILLSISAIAQEAALWLRYPAISPDGSEIVFSYKGDLFKVSSSGGAAMPLTLHDAHDYMPVWSPDGKQIAFASDRYGNFDVYVMPSAGGEAKRLTAHSANDFPWDFSSDGINVVFSSGRNDLSSSVRFPNNSLFGKLYSVPATGGRSIRISTAGFQEAMYDSKGEKIVFQDRKGYEDEWRKHHTSSVTRDIWMYDINNESYTKLSDFEGEDREPLFSADDKYVYYLSEKQGDQNIFRKSLAGDGAETRLTSFEDHPVRHLSRSGNNTLCFTWNGEIYTMQDGGQPVKVNIRVPFDIRGKEDKIVSVSSGATEMALSPNGKEIAFVFRGEVFVSAVDGNATKRVTNTSAQERMLSWAPDSKTLYYSTERGNSWDIYMAKVVREEEPYFFASTIIKEEPLIATGKDEFQPKVSPDGKEIAYLEERNTLRVYSIQSKASRTIIPEGQNFSYRDGDQDYTWSPDSKWLVAKSSRGLYGASYLVIYDVQNPGEGINLTTSGFSDGNPRWTMDGKALLWVNDKEGKMPLALQGAREVDIYAMFFDQESYDRFLLNKDEYALLKEKEDKEKKEAEKEPVAEPKKGKAVEAKPAQPVWTPNFKGLENRRVRLTPGSVNLAGFSVAPKGEKLFFMARFEQGYNAWVVDTRTKELKLLARLDASGGSMEISDDGKTLFVLANGRIQKIDAESGKVTPVAINSEMVLNTAGEREYIFNHTVRQIRKKFYDPKLHGIDWDMYCNNYTRFLPHINNNYDFQELLSEILGELNGSH